LAEVLKVSSERPEVHILQYAAGVIARGQVVCIPTDTLYGLAADPFNLAAVQQVYRVKGRPETRALPILISSLDQVVVLARDIPDGFFLLAKRFWPGALTLVLDASDRLPLRVTGNTGGVAVRWPKSRVACGLVETVGSPITGTSANISGFPACSNAVEAAKQLGDRVPLILDAGETGAVLASTIVDLRGGTWRIAREGIIPESEIAAALGQ
jgi:tRNA threonylcarbamoyl adenosine modification protein (Sua5/YciO/YrdC/YwlC family)